MPSTSARTSPRGSSSASGLGVPDRFFGRSGMDRPELSAYESVMTIARAEELALLFHDARTHSAWLDRPVDDSVLRQLYDLVRTGPTGANAQTLRVVFVRSAEAKARLEPALKPLNVGKAKAAPVTAITAFDVEFYEKMPKLFPARPQLRQQFAELPPDELARRALFNATLQTGYLVLAARALGL